MRGRAAGALAELKERGSHFIQERRDAASAAALGKPANPYGDEALSWRDFSHGRTSFTEGANFNLLEGPRVVANEGAILEKPALVPMNEDTSRSPYGSDDEEDEELAVSADDQAGSPTRAGRRASAMRSRTKRPRASKPQSDQIKSSLASPKRLPSISQRASATRSSVAVQRGSLLSPQSAAAKAQSFASELTSAAAFAAQYAAENATKAPEAVAAVMPESARKVASDGAEKTIKASKAVKAAVVDTVADATDRCKATRMQWAAFVEAWVKQKVKKQIERFIDRLPGIAKSLLEDPDMPRCVSRGKDRMVDGVWPDVREEMLWEVAVILDGQKEFDPDSQGPDCVRAFLRYHIYPFDKSFWGKLRDPVWVLLTLTSLIPVSGVSPIMYLFFFLLIDKSDEFQLIAFILQFKGTQFISLGILRTFIGFFLFISCVTAKSGTGKHSCDKDGPGVAGNFVLTIAGFLLQLVLVWIAFFLLPWSVEKGRATLKGSIRHEQSGQAHVQGGYVRNLMFYDLVCFITCMVALVIVWTMSPEYDDWPVRHVVYACQVVYGYLSMPFFFFTIPVLRNVLTHAMPTAYDPQGRCRRFAKPARKRGEDKRAQEARTDEEILEDGEATDLLDKAKAMFLGEPRGLGGTRRSPDGLDPLEEGQEELDSRV